MSDMSRPVSAHIRSYSSPNTKYRATPKPSAKTPCRYRWDASIPYNWSILSSVQFEKVEPSREMNTYEAVASQKRFITEMYQAPASSSPLRVSSSPAKKSPSKYLHGEVVPSNTPQGGGIPKPVVPRLLSLLSKAKGLRFVQQKANPASARILNLCINLRHPHTAESSGLHVAFPRSQLRKSPSRPHTPARLPFKNKSIEDYLTRFDKKRPAMSRTCASYQSQSNPRSRDTSRGEGGWLTTRERSRVESK